MFVAGLGITPRHVEFFRDAEFVAELTGVRIVSLELTPPNVIEIADGAGETRLVSVVDDKGAKLYGLPTSS